MSLLSQFEVDTLNIPRFKRISNAKLKKSQKKLDLSLIFIDVVLFYYSN